MHVANDMQIRFDGRARWASPLLLTTLVACGTTSADGADGDAGPTVDAATATRHHCPQTLEALCSDAGSSDFFRRVCCTSGPDCLGQRPATLASFCSGTADADSGVFDYASCRGFDVVAVSSGVDSIADFYYGADGKLVAVGNGIAVTESCLAGPADFSSPIGGACGGTGQPQCCYLEPGPSAELGCPVDAGTRDAGVD